MLGDIFCLFPFGENKDLYCLKSPEAAFVFYPKFKNDLISGKKTKCDGRSEILKWFNKIEDENYIYVFHLSYEYGHYQYDNQWEIISDSCCLGVLLKFKRSSLSPLGVFKNKESVGLSLKAAPQYKSYRRDFNSGLNELMNGNCYQYNLTYPFLFEVKNLNRESLISSYVNVSKFRQGRFSMLTYIESLGKAFWSNTPESLFQLKRSSQKTIIQTLPIKGTSDIKKSGGKLKAWKKLKDSEKDQAELYMITDLLRNDLNKIERPVCEVIKKKVPLHAPGIIHQMSLIQISLSPKVLLSKVIMSLFPGGSITGAPKKRVMEILSRIEARSRGLYCGSTIMTRDNRVDCSVNIRTAEIDLASKTLTYSAGGGITVLSDPKLEYEEMLLKVKSFTDIIKR